MAEALHLQILQALRNSIVDRREELCTRTGNGLEDREYQRHVGRIKECTVTIEDIERFLKAGVDAVDDEDEKRDKTQRTQKRT